MFPVWNACLQKDSILTHYSVWMKKKKQLLNIYQLDIFIHMLLLTPSLAASASALAGVLLQCPCHLLFDPRSLPGDTVD